MGKATSTLSALESTISRLRGLGSSRERLGQFTGVGSDIGMGAAAAKLFAREGAAHIYLVDYSDKEINPLLDHLKRTYPSTKVSFFKADAADPQAVSSIIDSALEAEGRFDFFFANAGILQTVDPTKVVQNGNGASTTATYLPGEDEFMEVVRVNSLGPYIAIRYASAAMGKVCPEKGKYTPGGSIVITSSVAGLKNSAGPIPYSASKAAVISMAQTSAWAFAGKNIRVNAVCPGVIETNMLLNAAKADHKGYGGQEKLNPLQRQGFAFEIAHMTLFLVSVPVSPFRITPRRRF
ncbi:hypothetical protein L202_07743 [Cryptococcus amylolentus CBS 6039]|uniref:NAD(P)-binding protein n=1 Tax=Cryptococcus amylolentus CBS 6039 TaxID=1295533 RepID=A0A1E3HA04_9TREE|nr:hypothetical protein L202_07743 [Cryptococcus amylolentus CBS 6039]ODN73182.1 hypothetical protein L202_07743 [Cryptococcus amylolentus CBS 6039]